MGNARSAVCGCQCLRFGNLIVYPCGYREWDGYHVAGCASHELEHEARFDGVSAQRPAHQPRRPLDRESYRDDPAFKIATILEPHSGVGWMGLLGRKRGLC